MIRGTGRLAWGRRATAVAFLVLLALAGRAEVDWLRGSTTGTEVAGVVPLTDPLAALEVTLATREFGGAILFGAVLLLAFAAVMGPVFCGWVCPVGFLLDLNHAFRHWLQRVLRRHGRALPSWRAPSGTRLVILGAVLGFALVAQLPLFQTVSPIHIAGLAVAFSAGPALLVLAVLAVVEWFVPRLWCRALCPLGETYSLAGRLAPFRVRVTLAEAGKVPCRSCTRHCPMDIPVMEGYALKARRSVDDSRCTRCGACTDACPRGVLHLGFRDPNRAGVAARGPARSRQRSLEVPA